MCVCVWAKVIDLEIMLVLVILQHCVIINAYMKPNQGCRHICQCMVAKAGDPILHSYHQSTNKAHQKAIADLKDDNILGSSTSIQSLFMLTCMQNS